MEQSSTKVANGGILVKFAAAYWASSTQINWRLGLFSNDKVEVEQPPPKTSLLPFFRLIYSNEKLLLILSLQRFELLDKSSSVSSVCQRIKSFKLTFEEQSIFINGLKLIYNVSNIILFERSISVNSLLLSHKYSIFKF